MLAKRLTGFAVTFAAALCGGCGTFADQKTEVVNFATQTRATIVGRWELPRDQVKFTYEFTKDGAVVVVAKSALSTHVIHGTYEITDEKITYKMMLGGEQKVTTASILILTDTVLVEKNSEENLTFTRIKDK